MKKNSFFFGIDLQKRTSLKIRRYIGKNLSKIVKLNLPKKTSIMHFAGYSRVSQCDDDILGCVDNNIKAPIKFFKKLRKSKIEQIIYLHTQQYFTDRKNKKKTIYSQSKSFLESFLIDYCAYNEIKLKIIYLPDIFFIEKNSNKYYESVFNFLSQNKKITIFKKFDLNFVNSKKLIIYLKKILITNNKKQVTIYDIKPSFKMSILQYINKLKKLIKSNSIIRIKEIPDIEKKIENKKIFINDNIKFTQLLKMKFKI